MSEFFRFPHTPHLAWLAEGAPRDDKVLSLAQAADFLKAPVIVEEKLDGANLGLSISDEGVLRAQNRGHYIVPPYHGQFSPLGRWLQEREEVLFDSLGTNLIAFGEWCAARHSLHYECLPDLWLVFDVYDRIAGKFWSTPRRDAWASSNGMKSVPRVFQGRFSLQRLCEKAMQQQSKFRRGAVEGLMVRRENTEWLEARAKIVRPGFVQSMGSHWRSRTLEWNKVQIGQ